MKLLDHDIAPLGMGCWAIGGAFYTGEQNLGFANVDDGMSMRTIHGALDAGVRLFDTAGVYGAGHSERLLGKALKGRSDALVVSKLGTAFDEETRQVLGDETSANCVAAAIDSCLRRLQRDCVDMMLLHLNSLSLDLAEPIFEQMEKARLAGKVGAFGWSTDFPASVAAMAKYERFVGVEHSMNLFFDAPSMQSCVTEHNLVALIRSPLAMGLLTGKYNHGSVMPSDDVRSINSERRDYFHDGMPASKHLEHLDAIRELLQHGGRSLAQGAISWLWAKSNRNIPLPGARTVEQVIENAGAIDFGPLPDEVMAEIETLIQRPPEGKVRAR